MSGGETKIDRVIQTLKTSSKPIPRVNVELLIKGLEELKSMIGLNEIKDKVINQVLHAIFFADDPDPEVLYNVIITGPPGVGKSLLIKTLANIWSSIELLKPEKAQPHFEGSQHLTRWLTFVKQQAEEVNDELGEAGYQTLDGVDVHQRLNWINEVCDELVANVKIPKNVYVGRTPKICYIRRDTAIGTHQGEPAKWTSDLLNSAIGGVVVIDEIYGMINGDEGNDEFGRECVNTINQFITDHPDTRFIIAGYEENIRNSIFRFQPGMESRFPWKFKIEGYKPTELTEMFVRRQKLALGDNVTKEWILKKIETNPQLFSAFGRSIVQFSFHVGVIVAGRSFHAGITREEAFVTKEDVLQALEELKALSPSNDNISRIYT